MKYYSIGQAAKLLGYSRWLLYKKIKAGILKAERPAGFFLVPVKEVEKYLALKDKGAGKYHLFPRAKKRKIDRVREQI